MEWTALTEVEMKFLRELYPKDSKVFILELTRAKKSGTVAFVAVNGTQLSRPNYLVSMLCGLRLLQIQGRGAVRIPGTGSDSYKKVVEVMAFNLHGNDNALSYEVL